ncbi:hypothetical protein [Paraliobacillus sp. JSM ZJ581]|uniref:hypothetical protein n=1 Tax=Paraliobacillus sp. JSM ZJ581 TaxID=3342118 RepID=UPI0035A947E0
MLLTIVALYILFLLKTVKHRKKITCMTGMMISMASGMSIGLIAGVLLAIYFSGNLFISTVLGMLIGIVAGLLPGLFISMMAVLDGILSGAMAGMMGAMLGEMVFADYRGILVKLMFLLFVFTLLIVFYILNEELGISHKSIFRNHVVLPILIVVFFVIFNQLGPLFLEDNINQNHSHNEHQTSNNQMLNNINH